MTVPQQLTDEFIESLIRILELPTNHRLNADTEYTKVSVTAEQMEAIYALCDNNRDERVKYNTWGNPPLNPSWPYDTLNKYFLLTSI